MRFTKRYRTEAAASRAQAHHRWLSQLGLPAPALTACAGRVLEFQHLAGRHVAPHDVPAAARLLGTAHIAAYRGSLADARLDERFDLPGVGWLEAFTTSRIARVRHNLRSGAVPDPAFTEDGAARLLDSAADEPAAFYKDANPRNFLITEAGLVLLDFDDLTLAPFGYDLAKLLVTTAMTHGPLPSGITGTALDAYNRVADSRCTPSRLSDWMEMHHVLTSPYLRRNGYAYSWHTLRPENTRPQ